MIARWFVDIGHRGERESDIVGHVTKPMVECGCPVVRETRVVELVELVALVECV